MSIASLKRFARLPAFVAIALVASIASAGGAPTKTVRSHHGWSYAGANGPGRWHMLDRTFSLCGTGHNASPVDLSGAITADLPPLRVDQRPIAFHVKDTEHAVQADAVEPTMFTAGADRYRLAQFHFHYPAEHFVGRPDIVGELHLVHVVDGDRIGVIGVPLRIGRPNAAIGRVLAALHSPGRHDVRMAARDLLPGGKTIHDAYFRYEGSLTTPPCSETVDWFVLADPIDLSAGQLHQIASLHGRNARPLQQLNRRFVLRARH